MKADQGPEELVEICFDKLKEGRGAFAFNVSEAVLPVLVTPEITADTLPLVLTYVPAAEAVTLMVTVQLPPAETEPLDKVMEFDVLATVPLH